MIPFALPPFYFFCPFVLLSFYFFVRLSFYFLSFLSFCPFIFLSVCSSVCLSFYFFVLLSVAPPYGFPNLSGRSKYKKRAFSLKFFPALFAHSVFYPTFVKDSNGSPPRKNEDVLPACVASLPRRRIHPGGTHPPGDTTRIDPAERRTHERINASNQTIIK